MPPTPVVIAAAAPRTIADRAREGDAGSSGPTRAGDDAPAPSTPWRVVSSMRARVHLQQSRVASDRADAEQGDDTPNCASAATSPSRTKTCRAKKSGRVRARPVQVCRASTGSAERNRKGVAQSRFRRSPASAAAGGGSGCCPRRVIDPMSTAADKRKRSRSSTQNATAYGRPNTILGEMPDRANRPAPSGMCVRRAETSPFANGSDAESTRSGIDASRAGRNRGCPLARKAPEIHQSPRTSGHGPALFRAATEVHRRPWCGPPAVPAHTATGPRRSADGGGDQGNGEDPPTRSAQPDHCERERL